MRELLAHVLTVVRDAEVGPVTVVSAEPLELDGVPRFDDGELPWNEALSAAMADVVEEPVAVIVAADLPLLTRRRGARARDGHAGVRDCDRARL